MITVAEPPLEFIPRGRPTVEDHPGPAEQQLPKHLPTEHLLLQRLANVNISSTEEPQEFWSMREICDDSKARLEREKQKRVLIAMQNDTTNCKYKRTKSQKLNLNAAFLHEQRQQAEKPTEQAPIHDHIVNNEEELYVNKNTVVWTKGLHEEDTVLQHVCFTCETPVKFAFFVSREFVRGIRKQVEAALQPEEDTLTAICVIDKMALHVYCNDGEDYITKLEFPISHVWPTKHGLLLEKHSGSAIVQNLTIPMPRLFSLMHPQDEMSPVLLKTSTNSMSYMTEADFQIVYSDEHTDIVLLFDVKIFKHFVSRLRKVTPEESQQFQSTQNETQLSQTLHRSSSFVHSSAAKNTGATPKKNASCLGRSTTGASIFSSHLSRLASQSQSFSGAINNLNRTSAGTHLSNLQSTIGHHSVSIQDMRKAAQVKPAKPIEPELCLEYLWTENTFGTQREFCEMATKAFVHTDLVGETFLCYLLQRSCRLQMVSITGYGTSQLQFSLMATTIAAKDAVCLKRMQMLVVLEPTGSLVIYTGTVLISKVNVTPGFMTAVSTNISTATTTTPNAALLQPAAQSPNSSFPKRSSLLPSAQKSGDSIFDEELHLLSPVHPLPSQYPTSRQINNVCLSLRDPAGNRVTLVYASGRMLRISLPHINESSLVSLCIRTLRQVLTKDMYLQFVIRWYSARNPPGAQDFSTEHEWQLFETILLSLMGCTSKLEQENAAGDTFLMNRLGLSTTVASEEKKRRKYNDHEDGTDSDWEYLCFALSENGIDSSCPLIAGCGIFYSVDTNATLFTMLPAIFYCFHLLYEDIKLNAVLHDYLPNLASFLYQLAIDMQLGTYILHYIVDFPELAQKTSRRSMLTAEHGALMKYQELLSVAAPSIYAQLELILRNTEGPKYSFVHGINELSRNVVQIFSLIMHGHQKLKTWLDTLEFPNSVQSTYPKRKKRSISTIVPRHEQVLQLLINMDMTRTDIERLPVAIHLVIAESLEQARLSPPIGSSSETYELILRPELVQHANLLYLNGNNAPSTANKRKLPYMEDSLSTRCPPNDSSNTDEIPLRHDGMDNIDTKLLRLRFPDDMRIEEVRRLLTSSEPVSVEVIQSPGISDHEFIEEQEKQLFALCSRTMTLSLGRGMFTLRTLSPRPVDNMVIPKLCLVGREPTKGATIEMQQIEYPANMHMWPSFHNGVAAGLQISPHAKDIDSTWIVYNKPKNQGEYTLEHAGFLMALGLNGHLKTLTFMSIYEYLVKCDEMTSVGLLLGISAAHRGSMDTTITKLLSVHIEALLPATALELDIPQSIQVAALMGVGLLYQGSAKRHIAEVLLQEIGRPPGPEMENSVERESYALTAGLALGLVTLGHGESPAGLRDLQLPDTLHYYMVGGHKRALTGSQKEKYRLASFQVREGDNVNIDVTAPGATLALGLMFFNSSNEAIAEWFNPPDSSYLLDMVRPDFLMLRTITRGLIMWQDVSPTEQWLDNQFPANLRPYLAVPKPTDMNEDDEDEQVDYEAVAQAYCNIVAGAAFCVGLKYSGTEDKAAFKTLRGMIKEFLSMSSKPFGEYAGRTTVENSLMVLLIAISLVFAGSGDCEILRIIRYLRSRVGNHYPHVTYGSHMAIHMSLGLLFMGAGRFTIAKTPEAIAALVCAFFPKFPIHSNDNRYHLQALRHLYVLAVEPRLFLPRDIDTHLLCLCYVSVLEIGASELRRLPIAPCILPELSTLQKVIVDDEIYWPVCFERGRNWEQLVKALEHSACIDIKKRTGCLSHLEDPDRLKSMLAQTLTKEQYVCWEVDTKELERFASERFVKNFLARFLNIKGVDLNFDQLADRHQITMLFYNAVIKDKMHVLPIYLTFYDHVTKMQTIPDSNDVWQVKLIDVYMSSHLFNNQQAHLLVTEELIQMMVEAFKMSVETALQDHSMQIRHFLTHDICESNWIAELSTHDVARMLAVMNFFNMMPNLLNAVDLSIGPINYMRILLEFKRLKIDANTIFGMLKILQVTSNGIL